MLSKPCTTRRVSAEAYAAPGISLGRSWSMKQEVKKKRISVATHIVFWSAVLFLLFIFWKAFSGSGGQ